VADRDIVQFVPMRDIMKHTDEQEQPNLLAKEVLAELPGQIVDFFKRRNLTPDQIQAV
jgi:hypothetical protein